MDTPWIAAGLTLLLWWLSTGTVPLRLRATDNGPPVRLRALPLLSSSPAMAYLEQRVMVRTLPDRKLRRWMMPAPKPMPKD